MANFIKPYNDDPFVGHLATPITSSAVTRAILKNLPAYRFGLTPLLRGLEIGLAHGYFLMGPFVKLGPLRNSDIALFSGFLSTIGLILIFAIMYFLLIRPQQKKVKEHQAMVGAVRRGDQVVTQGGLIGKVTKVKEDNELEVEVADGVKVRVVQSTLADVRSKTEPANDA
jgi:preprotein translocase subunit YajC